MQTFNTGFLIFPHLTQLDFTRPPQVLARLPQSKVHILGKSKDPVSSDCGLDLLPTCTFESCPDLDLICVPGGAAGVTQAVKDAEIIAFVRDRAARAKYVTSVCTGASVLGAAGVLRGRRATTHWPYTDLLPVVGAIYQKARIIRDGNLTTAGGVTSGIDFALSLVAEIAGEETAKRSQLGIEYDPAPPFDCGTPDRAPQTIKAALADRYAKANRSLAEALAG